MTYIGVTNIVSKFGGILFTPIHYSAKLQDPWRSGFLCGARMDPPPFPKPLQQPRFICQHTATAYLSQLTNTVPDTACFVCRVHWSPLWVEIWTLAYKTNTNCWPEMRPVVYCTHIFCTKLMLKNWEISTKVNICNYKIAHRCASCSTGVLCRGWGPVTCNTQQSIY